MQHPYMYYKLYVLMHYRTKSIYVGFFHYYKRTILVRASVGVQLDWPTVFLLHFLIKY